MKLVVQIIRFFVGILFIFSGLVKAIDPHGLSYKMQEYFDLWGMSSFNSYTLWMSILMIAAEIIAGAALLIGWRPKLINWFLLLLIVFFTFLTGFSYLSGKFKNCGCFGDCIPITAQQSFYKDIILLILILILFWFSKYIKPIAGKKITNILLLLSVMFSFAIQWYALKNLPIVDCLGFKKNAYIPTQMLMPANAIPDSVVINYVYKKDGKEVSFTADAFPDDFDDSTYLFIKRDEIVVRAGKNNTPPIKGFVLENENKEDQVPAIVAMPKVYLLFVEDEQTKMNRWKEKMETLYQDMVAKNTPLYIVTANYATVKPLLQNSSLKNVQLLQGDRVMIRTAARANPTLYLIEKGTIMNKWSSANFNDVLK